MELLRKKLQEQSIHNSDPPKKRLEQMWPRIWKISVVQLTKLLQRKLSKTHTHNVQISMSINGIMNIVFKKSIFSKWIYIQSNQHQQTIYTPHGAKKKSPGIHMKHWTIPQPNISIILTKKKKQSWRHRELRARKTTIPLQRQAHASTEYRKSTRNKSTQLTFGKGAKVISWESCPWETGHPENKCRGL